MQRFDTVPLASELVRWLTREMFELRLPAGLRTRLAGPCFAVTQEHQHAIVTLLGSEPPLRASALALVRIQFEAYVRGMWLSHCANDEQLEQFSIGHKPPSMPAQIAAIEAVSGSEGAHLSKLYRAHWSAMCAYAHTGLQQVQRWNTEDAIEPNYDPQELREVLALSSAVALLSSVGVAALAGNDALAQRILEKSGVELRDEA